MEPGIFASFPKNITYRFLMESIIDKQEKWLRNLVPHPICFLAMKNLNRFIMTANRSWTAKTRGLRNDLQIRK